MKNEPIQRNAIYSLEETTRLLGISRRTFSKYIKKDLIKPIIFGNKYRFRGDQILDFCREIMLSKIVCSNCGEHIFKKGFSNHLVGVDCELKDTSPKSID